MVQEARRAQQMIVQDGRRAGSPDDSPVIGYVIAMAGAAILIGLLKALGLFK
jgi:hypothetical protein